MKGNHLVLMCMCLKRRVLNTTVLVLCVHVYMDNDTHILMYVPSAVLCILCLYQELWG